MNALDKIPVVSYTLGLNMLSAMLTPHSEPVCLYLTPWLLPTSSFQQGWEMPEAAGVFAGFFAVPYLLSQLFIFLIDFCDRKLPPKPKAACARILGCLFQTLAVVFAATLPYLIPSFLILRVLSRSKL